MPTRLQKRICNSGKPQVVVWGPDVDHRGRNTYLIQLYSRLLHITNPNLAATNLLQIWKCKHILSLILIHIASPGISLLQSLPWQANSNTKQHFYLAFCLHQCLLELQGNEQTREQLYQASHHCQTNNRQQAIHKIKLTKNIATELKSIHTSQPLKLDHQQK